MLNATSVVSASNARGRQRNITLNEVFGARLDESKGSFTKAYTALPDPDPLFVRRTCFWWWSQSRVFAGCVAFIWWIANARILQNMPPAKATKRAKNAAKIPAICWGSVRVAPCKYPWFQLIQSPSKVWIPLDIAKLPWTCRYRSRVTWKLQESIWEIDWQCAWFETEKKDNGWRGGQGLSDIPDQLSQLRGSVWS